MWTLLSGLALASPAVTPLPTPSGQDFLPLQVDDEPRWASVDSRATRLSRTAGFLSIVGGGSLAAGAGIAVWGESAGSELLVTGGGLFAVGGGVLMLVAPPMQFGGSLRAQRSLRERGVHVTTSPAVAGWTMFGLSGFALAVSVAAPPFGAAFGPAYYAAMVSCGWAQVDLNRRVRDAAGLDPVANKLRERDRFVLAPSVDREGTRGFRLAGTF